VFLGVLELSTRPTLLGSPDFFLDMWALACSADLVALGSYPGRRAVPSSSPLPF
jgi:hypothetical protein